jgi:hypothetical protein
MPQPSAATYHLTRAEDRQLAWGRYYELELTLNKSTGPDVALDMSGGDVSISSLKMQIRLADAAGTLIATGSPVFTAPPGDGSTGLITLVVPETGWATGTNQTATCVWDLVGITSANKEIQLLQGKADIERTVTVVT